VDTEREWSKRRTKTALSHARLIEPAKNPISPRGRSGDWGDLGNFSRLALPAEQMAIVMQQMDLLALAEACQPHAETASRSSSMAPGEDRLVERRTLMGEKG
jgi:hypothetical protein